MSTANKVPETWNLTGDDATETLANVGRGALMRDAFLRLRWADGFSHARSMAYATTLIFVQGVIALVGLASVLGAGGARDLIVNTLRAVAPGPTGQVLTEAAGQARQAGSSHPVALILGTIGATFTAAVLMGQIERALNRIYGVEQDRPTMHKYVRAVLLALSAGLVLVVAVVALALGRDIGASIGSPTVATIWSIVRWPLALVLLGMGTALLFRHAPKRHQPGWSWLAFGAAVSVVLLLLVTVGLDVMFGLSSTFGATYGPLAGIVALMFWALAASVSFLYGAALSAQLEAVRAGVATPQDASKARDGAGEPATLSAR
ncbi:MAG: YihY/virulence factor BrkB family protein [Actinomycetota bacterium]